MSGWSRSLFSAGLAICGLFSGCSKPERDSSESVLRISQRNEPGVLDPALATLPDEFFIIRALSEGLVTPSPDGGPEIAAAQSWDVSADGLTYTFHLRPNATWSNGEPLTAADFLASYRRVLSPKTAAPKANLFFLVQGAEAFYRGELTDFSQVGFTVIDSQTLRVTLEHPAPQFLAYVASGPWIPVNPRTVERHGSRWATPENYVGNGPFRLVDWKPNQHITVQRRAEYWDADHVLVDAIRFQAFDNADAEERAYRAGQIDITMSVPFTKIAGYAAQDESPLRQIPLHETRFLAFNTLRPPLDDVRVRRALSLAIDRPSISQHVLRGKQKIATHFVPVGLGGFQPTQTLSTDADEARRLLTAAGYPEGKGFPVLEMTGWGQTAVLEVVQAMWKKELGITVNIGVRDAKVHVSDLTNGQYDIGFITAIPDVADPIDMLKDLETGASNNYSQWSHPEYDALLRKSEQLVAKEERLAILAQAEALISEHCPIAPLYFNAKNILQRKTVHGWQEDALWTRFYKDVLIKSP